MATKVWERKIAKVTVLGVDFDVDAEDFNYVAVDECGAVWAYSTMPVIDSDAGMWTDKANTCFDIGELALEADDDWTQSLVNITEHEEKKTDKVAALPEC